MGGAAGKRKRWKRQFGQNLRESTGLRRTTERNLMTANIASERSRILASPAVIPLAVGLCLYGLLLFAGNRLLNDPDSYWHLVVGRWIVERRALPIADPFSFTMTGAHW